MLLGIMSILVDGGEKKIATIHDGGSYFTFDWSWLIYCQAVDITGKLSEASNTITIEKEEDHLKKNQIKPKIHRKMKNQENLKIHRKMKISPVNLVNQNNRQTGRSTGVMKILVLIHLKMKNKLQ